MPEWPCRFDNVECTFCPTRQAKNSRTKKYPLNTIHWILSKSCIKKFWFKTKPEMFVPRKQTANFQSFQFEIQNISHVKCRRLPFEKLPLKLLQIFKTHSVFKRSIWERLQVAPNIWFCSAAAAVLVVHIVANTISENLLFWWDLLGRLMASWI